MTAIKVTQKQIRQYANDRDAHIIDVTKIPYKDACELIEKARAGYVDDNGYDNTEQIAYSCGTYGCNGWIYRVGYHTVVCCERCGNLYLFV